MTNTTFKGEYFILFFYFIFIFRRGTIMNKAKKIKKNKKK